MPEWSNGAVSKTVDRIHDPRVRIPFSPHKKKRSNIKLLLFFYDIININININGRK